VRFRRRAPTGALVQVSSSRLQPCYVGPWYIASTVSLARAMCMSVPSVKVVAVVRPSGAVPARTFCVYVLAAQALSSAASSFGAMEWHNAMSPERGRSANPYIECTKSRGGLGK